MCANIMNCELTTLASFSNIPVTTSGKDYYYSLLAEDGFYYTGVQDEVVCWKCCYKIRIVNCAKLNEQRKLHSLSCNVGRDSYPKCHAESALTLNKARAKLASNDSILYQQNNKNRTFRNNELTDCGLSTGKDMRMSGDNIVPTKDVINVTSDDCRKYTHRSGK